jgi:hypothetical protein
MAANVLWYGVVRDYEAKTYQFTMTFFTSHKASQTSETRMHYTMCYMPLVCPAMNQGTFKYKNLSVNQEACSLKLIHHNFK